MKLRKKTSLFSRSTILYLSNRDDDLKKIRSLTDDSIACYMNYVS